MSVLLYGIHERFAVYFALLCYQGLFIEEVCIR